MGFPATVWDGDNRTDRPSMKSSEPDPTGTSAKHANAVEVLAGSDTKSSYRRR